MQTRKIAQTVAAFVVGSTLAALVLVFILSFPPLPISKLGYFSQLMLLSLVGPVLFAWAWGPSPMGLLGLLFAVAIPLASIAPLWLGFFRRGSYLALVCSAAIWSVFGGLSALMAVTGSV